MQVTVCLANAFTLELTLREPYFRAEQPTEITNDALRCGHDLSDDVHVALDEETISQPHGEFSVRAGHLVYRDLNSHYGTIFLDGYTQIFESRVLGGYRELAALAEESRDLEYEFKAEDFGKDLTLQLGQVGVVLVVTSRTSDAGTRGTNLADER